MFRIPNRSRCFNYRSCLAAEIVDYVNERKLLEKLDFEREQRDLLKLDNFLIEKGVAKKEINQELATQYAERIPPEKAVTQRQRIYTYNGFANYLRNNGIYAFICRTDVIKIEHTFKTYIFSQEELDNIVRAFADLKPYPSAPYRNIIYPLMFSLLIQNGFRIGELLSLKIGQVHFEEGTIEIVNSKFHKSRQCHIDPILMLGLKALRETILISCTDDDPIFIQDIGQPLLHTTVYMEFRNILSSLGIRYCNGHWPRIHDIRHTYCVHIIEQAMRMNKADAMFFITLSKYLGHSSVNNTMYYIHLTHDTQTIVRRKMLESGLGEAIGNDFLSHGGNEYELHF